MQVLHLIQVLLELACTTCINMHMHNDVALHMCMQCAESPYEYLNHYLESIWLKFLIYIRIEYAYTLHHPWQCSSRMRNETISECVH